MRKSVIFSAACVILGLALLLESVKIRPLWAEPMGPAVFPRVLSCLLVLAAGSELVREILAVRRERKGKRSGENGRDRRSAREMLGILLENRAVVSVGYMAVLSLAYVFGLAYIGFYVSTSVYVLASVGGLCYFSERETWLKRTLRIGIPMALIILGVLAFSHRYMHIYFPSKGILW